MPVTPTYPGVYIEEISSGVHTISGVATSITAFVGYTARGPDNTAKEILSFADFERTFGGLASDSELSYAVQQFFANGGSDAYVVRVPKLGAAPASVGLLDVNNNEALKVTAISTGVWANTVIIDVDYDGVGDAQSFNLTITDLATGTVETFLNVTMNGSQRNFVEAVVNDEDSGSQMVTVKAGSASSTAQPPVHSGTIGQDIADLKAIHNDVDYHLTITTDSPTGKISDVDFVFIGPSDAIPTSILGVCRLLERKGNTALAGTLPGASIQCVPTSSGKGIRVQARFSPKLLPDAQDAVVTFGAGSTNDISTTLGLNGALVSVNVGSYWMGNTRTISVYFEEPATPGSDGTALPDATALVGNDGTPPTGIYALNKVDLFNLLCIPDATRALASDPSQFDSNLDPSAPNTIFGYAMDYCKSRRAFLLIDPPPPVKDLDSATDWKSAGLKVHDTNGAAYFPRLRLPDLLNNSQLRTFAPCGVMAGVYATTDAQRGVWKAPAGTQAVLNGVQGMVYNLTDAENGVLNPLGLNCLRTFPVYGPIAWGARTLVGADVEANEWKYIPVRRLALFLEESFYRGTKWVVFEPNDEPLWSQIRLNVGAFMHDLFRQGAFQGTNPKDAYFVKCDDETTTQNDINLGIVNILVGFAPLKPAEFVIIQIQQMAGQIQV